MGWIELLPKYAPHFRSLGWESASSFLAWTGDLVNRHRHRQVERVTLPSIGVSPGKTEQAFYLKKEFAVSWRDRFRNAWQGFGWCSTLVREAKLLDALRQSGVGCPEVASRGEVGQQAYLLTRAEDDMTELRAFLLEMKSNEERNRLATALGVALARMHQAGFEHPDLFAKHILVASNGDSFRFCFLDWQRGRHRRVVSWRLRSRDLAVLNATLHPLLANDRLRVRLLRAYTQACGQGPSIGCLARRVRDRSAFLLQKRHIREIGQLPIPPNEQQFTSFCDGRLLVVRSCLENLAGTQPDWLISAIAKAEAGSPTWEFPPLAHTLFRLHRFGVPAPRLRAAGRSASGIFLLATRQATISLEKALAQASTRLRAHLLRQAGWIVRQIHEAGYRLPHRQSWARRLEVNPASGEIVFARIESLQSTPADWRTLAGQEFVDQDFHGSKTDRMRFLFGYLQQSSLSPQHSSWIKSLLKRRERQAVA